MVGGLSSKGNSQNKIENIKTPLCTINIFCALLNNNVGLNVHQGHLENVIEILFKGESIYYCYKFNSRHFIKTDIQKDVRKKAKILSPGSNLYLELDIWIPNLKLSFEFQVLSNSFM